MEGLKELNLQQLWWDSLFVWTYADPGEVIEEDTHTVIWQLVAKTILVGVVNPLGDEERCVT